MTHLVLIPGMMCDARLFGPQVEALSDRHTVQVATITEHDSITELAADVLAHAPQAFAVAGLSMGGIVAMEMMAQAPTRLLGLGLLDTNASAETEVVKSGREPQIRKVRNGGLGDVMRDEMKPNYLARGPRRESTLKLCMDMAMSLGPDVFVRQSRALQTRPDQRATLQQVRVPTLIACGEDDRLCPVARHQLMQELIPHAHMEILPDAGHLPTLEQPAATSAILAAWLADIENASGAVA